MGAGPFCRGSSKYRYIQIPASLTLADSRDFVKHTRPLALELASGGYTGAPTPGFNWIHAALSARIEDVLPPPQYRHRIAYVL